MDMLPVDSSNIVSIGYDADTRELRIEFHSGLMYSYEDVPPETYEVLRDAPSVGKHFHAHIKPHYQGQPYAA